jgi:hypothetical protein
MLGALEGGNFVERIGLLLMAATEERTEKAGFEHGLRFDRLGVFERKHFVFGFLLLGLALGAFFTPIAVTVVKALAVDPPVLNAFCNDGEADGGGEVEACGCKCAGDEPGTLNVDVGDEQSSHEAADYALDGEEMKPAPVPGNEAEGGGKKDECEKSAQPAQEG